MTAYIEYVILDNLGMDVLICWITQCLMRKKRTFIRITLASLLGTVCAVVTPLLPYAFAVLVKIITAPLMCMLLIKSRKIKEYMLTLLVFLLVSFAIGGAVIAIFNMSASESILAFVTPRGGIVGLTAFVTLVIIYAFNQLSNVMRARPGGCELYKVDIIAEGRIHNVRAFYDSGNNLYDTAFRPVLILSRSKANAIKNCIEGGMLNVNTVNGAKAAKYYIIPEVKIYKEGQVNTLYNISCILSEIEFLSYDLLLHREIIKEG